MRKIRKAAVVATMVGSVGMVGAGVASAHGDGATPQSVTVNCYQIFGDTTSNTTDVAGLVTIAGPLVVLGDGESTANQPICGIANQGGNVSSGAATSGDGSIVG